MTVGVKAPSQSVPFQVVDPERIPAKRYYDEEFYRLECESLWPHVWQMACRLEQIQKLGDWVEYSNVGQSVIVVRTKDGVKAFHNACRHRGVQLVTGHGNCEVEGFICPFHGWRWNSEGKNTFVYAKHLFSEGQLDQSDLALVPCRVELWGGCAFINFDDDAPALRDCMGSLTDRLEAHEGHKLRAEWWYSTVLPANWKTAMEAFMEGFHVMRTHPQLQEAAGALYNTLYAHDPKVEAPPSHRKVTSKETIMSHFKHLELLSQGMAGMVHAKDIAVASTLLDIDLPEDPNQAVMTWYGTVNHVISEQARARGEQMHDINTVAVSHPLKPVEFIFPHYFLLPFFSSMSSYRIRPLGPESCLFELWSLTLFPEGKEPAPVMEPVILPYDSDKFPPIPRQDYANIPRQQIGLHAKGFEFMRLAKNEEGLISQFHRLLDGYLQGAAPDRLAKATAITTDVGFDSAIVDIGL
jgi:phenylpropionate dioxygenase-like ring-hydroxylating dioxygenase large terminal subunit